MAKYAILSDADGSPCLIEQLVEAGSAAQAFSKMVYNHASHDFMLRDDAPWHVFELPDEVWDSVYIKDAVYEYVSCNAESVTFDVDGMILTQ